MSAWQLTIDDTAMPAIERLLDYMGLTVERTWPGKHAVVTARRVADAPVQPDSASAGQAPSASTASA